MRYTLTAFATLLSLSTVGAPARADAPIAVRPNTIPYHFTVSIQTSGKKAKDEQGSIASETKLRIDPSQPPGDRVTVLATSTRDHPAAVQRVIKKFNSDQISETFWCGVETDFDPERAMLLSEDGQLATYELAPDPLELEQKIGGEKKSGIARKAAKYLRGSITIVKTTGSIITRRTWLSRAFKPNPLAKVTAVDGSRTCREAPNGQAYTYMSRQVVSAQAVGVVSVNTITVTRISDLTPLVPGPMDLNPFGDATP